jgi:dissimilatory sulfite reductase related protein
VVGTFTLSENGYLAQFSSWLPEFAQSQALIDGLELTAAHWELIQFLRSYFLEFEMAPPIRLLTKAVARRLGAEKGNSLYLYQLFPDGPAKQACRYAGLPKPISCI